jgi:PTH1 family peptidyl-tRNA hydrolase
LNRRLIAGLGNPGPRYSLTRHNAGFFAADRLIHLFGAADTATVENSPLVRLADRPDLYVLKPMSYMNLSGGPVAAALIRLSLTADDLLVIHDDIDLSLGDVRYKEGGGHGGHNGLKSLFDRLETAAFSRVRIGVGRPSDPSETVVDYVLGSFTAAEAPVVDTAVTAALSLVRRWAA